MTNHSEKVEEIDLLELFWVLLRKWWAILLAIVIFGSAAFGYTYFMVDPLYQSSTLMYVNNSNLTVGSSSFKISYSDLVAAQNLVDTYVVILKSRSALNEVIREADLNYSYDQLKGMISASAVNSTEIFEIVVTSRNPAEAEIIANTIAEVLPGKISDIVEGSDVRIVDYAVIPSHRSYPSYTRNTAIGMLLGAIVSAALIVMAYLFDENIRSEDYLAQAYPDIPLLSVIPDLNTEKQHGSGYYGYRRSSAYRREAPVSKAAGAGSNTPPAASTSKKGGA